MGVAGRGRGVGVLAALVCLVASGGGGVASAWGCELVAPGSLIQGRMASALRYDAADWRDQGWEPVVVSVECTLPCLLFGEGRFMPDTGRFALQARYLACVSSVDARKDPSRVWSVRGVAVGVGGELGVAPSQVERVGAEVREAQLGPGVPVRVMVTAPTEAVVPE